MQDDTLDLEQKDLESLKARADRMGMTYHPSIGAAKLREKIAEAMAEDVEEEEAPKAKKEEAETESQRRHRLRRVASELVRIRVTCMNPNKTEWNGEIFTAGNTLVGTFKKYVPFNADDGWHVPRIIYNQIKSRQCQIFVSQKDRRGNTVRQGKLIREFAVEELPPLTEKELAELARRQAVAKSVD